MLIDMTGASSPDLYQKLTKFIQETSNEQSEDLKKYIKTEIDEIKRRIDEETAERKKLEKELQILKSNHKKLEKELRKNNIIIFNLEYDEESDILEYTLKKLNQILEINITPETVNDIYAIGKKKKDRPIIVKFTSYLIKQTVLKNCKKLKGTKIIIAEQLSLEERKKQKILRQELKKARSKNITAYIKGEILYIGEDTYTAEELIENEEDSDKEIEIDDNIHTNDRKHAQNDIDQLTTNTNNTKQKESRRGTSEYDENKPKKRKIVNNTANIHQSRSSPRLTGKDTN